jgi:hypothetical protein
LWEIKRKTKGPIWSFDGRDGNVKKSPLQSIFQIEIQK